MHKEMLTEVLLDLEALGSIKFGEFKLKSGILSPVYFDLRLMVSKPTLMQKIANLLLEVNPSALSSCDLLCGVPYTALPIATLISVNTGKPMLIRRKEAKAYGTGQILEGNFNKGQNCVIIEDVVTSGTSILETANLLRGFGLVVDTALVFLDRSQGGLESLAHHGITAHCVTDIQTLVKSLSEAGRISEIQSLKVLDFTTNNKTPSLAAPIEVQYLSYEDRLNLSSKSGNISRLFRIMIDKKTNLCVSADLLTMEDIKCLVEKVGSKICCLKVHFDIIKDWTENSGKILKELAIKHNFLLIEDRKFFDIGNTVKLQLSSGVGRVCSWANFVTLVTMPGPGILDSLRIVREKENVEMEALIVAQMSSKGNFFTSDYSDKCVELLGKYPDVVSGLIAQSRLDKYKPDIVVMTPGVKLNLDNSESLGQQYISPEEAIMNRGADVVIVGRGVIEASDPQAEAELCRNAGWEAYLKRIARS